MQSILQYRRLRKEVKEDLKRFQDNKQRNSRSTSSFDADSDRDTEKQQDLIPGIRISGPAEHDGSITFLVGWKDEDALEPHNWSMLKRWWCTFAVCLITMAITIPASIDGPVADQFNEYYAVGPIAGSLTTGMGIFPENTIRESELTNE